MENEKYSITETEKLIIETDDFLKNFNQDRGLPYLEEIPKANKITILQFQQLFCPDVIVYVKPNNHKIYYNGSALYMPKDMYDWEVIDISLIKPHEQEKNKSGSVSLFVRENETYEKIADQRLLDDINDYYHTYPLIENR